jgi:hypothetical protein
MIMENKKTYLGKAMMQSIVGTILSLTAVSHTSMTWTCILGALALVWLASAHHNFNKYENRG